MGVDDGLALFLADRLMPGLCAVSTVAGNVPLPVATRNALLFRALLGREQSWPVLTGAGCASDGFAPDAGAVHGADGLGGATAAADPAVLARIAAEPVLPIAQATPPRAGPVTLIGIGPATNIPALVTWYGRDRVERIVLMSGVFFDVGNITPEAEFNAHSDPAALRATLDLGVTVQLIPLDVCRKIQLSRTALASFGSAHATALTRLISASHVHYMDFYRKWEGIDGCFPHDAITVLAALEPERFRCLRGQVTVATVGSERGKTSVKIDASSHIEIATGGDLKWVRETIARELTNPPVA